MDAVNITIEYAEGHHDTTCELDTTQIFSIQELINSQIVVNADSEIRCKDVISYIVLKWDTAVDPSWTVPDPILYHFLQDNRKL